jgi:hypothetical protein
MIRWAARAFLLLMLLAGLARAYCFLAYAFARIPARYEAFHLESKMVHLAWRAQACQRLYPDWTSYPYVANFFAPVYFLVVGAIGRVLGSSLDGLYLVGRGVTFASVVATTALLGVVTARRYGKGAGILGAVLSLGVAPLFGFGIMTRPDALADLLGLAGFFVATGRKRWLLYNGGILLVLAVLTKQTCGMYLLAASIALWFEGRRRDALGLLAGCLGSLLVVIGGASLLLEPNFARDLLAEGETPWDLRTWRLTAWRLTVLDPEWLFLAASGLVFWNTPGRRDIPATVLTITLLALGYTMIAKRGSDLNYVLGFRAIGALAAGAAWQAAWSPRGERSPAGLWAFVGLMGLGVATSILGPVNLLSSYAHAYTQAERSREFVTFLRSPASQRMLVLRRRLFQLAENPSTPILTDSGIIDIRQRERTAFGDPWLFRMLCDTGRLRPTEMARRAENMEYDWLITTKDIFSPSYESYDFGLPMSVIEPARRRYRPLGHEGGFFVYVPLRARPPDATGMLP